MYDECAARTIFTLTPGGRHAFILVSLACRARSERRQEAGGGKAGVFGGATINPGRGTQLGQQRTRQRALTWTGLSSWLLLRPSEIKVALGPGAARRRRRAGWGAMRWGP